MNVTLCQELLEKKGQAGEPVIRLYYIDSKLTVHFWRNTNFFRETNFNTKNSKESFPFPVPDPTRAPAGIDFPFSGNVISLPNQTRDNYIIMSHELPDQQK